ncbi:ATP-binding protein [Flavobacterium sp.]|uniref:ATP-binding protein n=1 Tax=Flavobacterium sp. TaxID=239 RepID=UPI00286E79D9|nr:ATP-binding protein [Flavobacterium sp.]
MIKRKKKTIIAEHLSKKEFTILIGARQIGKSTLLKQLYDDLHQKAEAVYFLNLDRKEILDELNESPENLFKLCPLQKDKKIIVFIDEIQYLDDATNFIKLLFDEYSNKLKIVATGSSAFYIDKQFNDSLVVRKKIFHMGTLDFEEFLLFKGRNDLVEEVLKLKNRKKVKSIQENVLWGFMDEFVNYGGYPAVVLENDINQKIELLKDIRDSFIKRDILESGITDESKFFRMLMLLASQSGNLLNVNEISNTLRITNATVENYLYILQKCFHITLVKPFYNNLRKELTKMPKVYINDLGLRNVLINYFSPLEQRADKGMVLENLSFRLLSERFDQDQIKYWRTADGNEVDFVIESSYLKGFAVEVKFNEQEVKLSKYNKFVQNYPDFPLEFWWWKKMDLMF